MKPLKSNVISLMFFLFIALVIGTFYRIYTAFETHPGLIVDDAYKKGEQYVGIINNNNKIQDSGWGVGLDIIGKLKSDSPINFNVDSSSKMDGKHKASFKILFYRPLEKKWDFEMNMNPSRHKNNSFEATTKFPLKGIWDIVVEGSQGELTNRIHKRIFLKD